MQYLRFYGGNMENETIIQEEITEVLPEEASEEVTEITEDQEQTTSEFTELLEEYIKSELEKDKNDQEDIENDTDQNLLLDSEEDLQNINNDLLSQILETELETKGEIVNQSLMMIDQEQNNTLNSDIETISLDNMLNLVLIATILFTSVITFARRIF